MLKARYWLGVVTAPILLASAGCAIGHRPFQASKRALPPERMMAMARTFERQGHLSQAKITYQQILQSHPECVDAQQGLQTLIANESNPDYFKKSSLQFNRPDQLASKSNSALAERRARELAELKKQVEMELAAADAPKPKRSRRSVPDQSAAADETIVQTSKSRSAADADHDVASTEFTPTIEEDFSDPVESEPQPALSAAPASPVIAPIEQEIPSHSRMASNARTRSNAPSHRADEYADDLNQPVTRDSAAATKADTDLDLTDPLLGSRLEANTDHPLNANSWSESSSVRETDDLPIVVDAAQSAPDDSIEFVKPVVRDTDFVDPSLKHYFGTFHPGLVQDVRTNREQVQSKLVEVAANQDADSEIRSRAVFLIGSIGSAAIEVVPALRREMHYDIDDFLRVDFSEAILKIQPEDDDAIQVLVDCLKESEDEVKWIAAYALRGVGSPKASTVVDALTDSLKTEDLKLRRMIFLTLAEFGPAAAKAIPELEAALESSDPAMREVAKASLACIDPDRKTTLNRQTTFDQNGYAVNK